MNQLPHPPGCHNLPFPSTQDKSQESLLTRFKRQLACRKSGGHYWHPEPGAMIDWFCCQCNAKRDGMPKDGT